MRPRSGACLLALAFVPVSLLGASPRRSYPLCCATGASPPRRCRYCCWSNPCCWRWWHLWPALAATAGAGRALLLPLLAAGPLSYLLLIWAEGPMLFLASRVLAGFFHASFGIVQAGLAEAEAPRERLGRHGQAERRLCPGLRHGSGLRPDRRKPLHASGPALAGLRIGPAGRLDRAGLRRPCRGAPAGQRARPGQPRPGRSKPGQARRGPSEAGPSEAGPSETGPSETGPSETGRTETGPSEALWPAIGHALGRQGGLYAALLVTALAFAAMDTSLAVWAQAKLGWRAGGLCRGFRRRAGSPPPARRSSSACRRSKGRERASLCAGLGVLALGLALLPLWPGDRLLYGASALMGSGMAVAMSALQGAAFPARGGRSPGGDTRSFAGAHRSGLAPGALGRQPGLAPVGARRAALDRPCPGARGPDGRAVHRRPAARAEAGRDRAGLARVMNIATLLDAAALRSPDATALVHPAGRFSFRRLAALSRRIAAGLARRGIGPGHRVGLCCSNRPAFVGVLFGALRAGATVMLYGTTIKAREASFLLRDGGLAALFCMTGEPGGASARRPRAEGLHDVWLLPEDLAARSEGGDWPGLARLSRGGADRHRPGPAPRTGGPGGRPLHLRHQRLAQGRHHEPRQPVGGGSSQSAFGRA